MTLLLSNILLARCAVPQKLQHLVEKSSLSSLHHIRDIRRNAKALKNMCLYTVSFREGKYHWKMLLVTHPKQPKGAFYFLPHDDENTAFDTAVYATQKYGGGFLAVMANDKRYFRGQDPNRNFGETAYTAKTCKKQKTPAPLYSQNVFKIIDAFKARGYPYMALHSNKDGHFGNGGSGGVSILRSSALVKSYPASENIGKKDRGLRDEDSLVYIAGLSKTPSSYKLQSLLSRGLNTRYEIINKASNDCSLSNYVVLTKGSTKYYNIEAQHGDLQTHKKMLDLIMELINN